MRRIIVCIVVLLTVALFMKCTFAQERYVWAYQGDVAFFQEDGKVGLQSREGEVLLPAQYDDGGVFGVHDVAMIRKGNRRGLVNRQGEIVVPLTRADYMGVTAYASGEVLDEAFKYSYSSSSDIGAGFYTLGGVRIGSQEWDFAVGFINGSTFVRKDEKWNLMDMKGNLLLDSWWDGIDTNFREGGGTISNENSVWEIDAQGRIQRKYARNTDDELTLLELYDEDGNLMDFLPWDDIRSFGEKSKRVKKDGFWNLINENGQVINGLEKCKQIGELIQPWGSLYQSVAYVTQDEKYGLIDSDGNYLLQLSGRVVDWLEPDRMLIRAEEGKFSIVDITGKVVKNIESKENRALFAYKAEEFIQFIERGENGDILQWGYMDYDGSILCSVSGSEYVLDHEASMHSGMICVEYKGQLAYMDAYGNILSSADWDARHSFSEGLAFVHAKDGYVIINTKGENLSQPREWESVDKFYWEGDQLVARVRGGEGIYTATGYVNDKGEPLCGVK